MQILTINNSEFYRFLFVTNLYRLQSCRKFTSWWSCHLFLAVLRHA